MTTADNNTLVVPPAQEINDMAHEVTHEVAHEVTHIDLLTTGRLCLNCGHAAPEKFCANCGQNTHAHPPSAAEFLHEFVGHYVALEGKLWSSLARLLFRPGNLTKEYVEGRRVRYVNPLRLYLTMSVLFFALLKFSHFSLQPGDVNNPAEAASKSEATTPAKGQPPAVKSDEEGEIAPGVILDNSKEKESLKKFEEKIGKSGTVGGTLLSKGSKLFQRPNEEITEIMTEGFFHYAPYAMFCMLPVFALLLKMLYLGRNRNYGEHLVFAMHTNAFSFALFFALALTPWTWGKTGLVLWLVAYLPLALHRVYGGRIVATVMRWMIFLAAYGICLVLAILACLLAVVALY